MAKAIKLSNDIYLDSTGIVHNKKKLSDILYEEVVLFEGASNKDITLLDNVENYDKVRVEYYTNYNQRKSYKSITLSNTNNKSVTLDFNDYFSGYWYWSFSIISISLEKISLADNRRLRVADSGTWTPYGSTTNDIYVSKVVGIKKAS